MQEREEMRAVYVQTLIQLAQEDPRVVVLDADLMKANGTMPFKERFPERTFDVGIAEANMIGVACGLSLEGFIPFPTTFATFATRRCYDQAVISNAYAGLNVKIVGTDPGISSELNGGTHMPTEDVALMRSIPGNTVVEFVDSASIRALLPQVKDLYGPCYLRLFRKKAEQVYEDGVPLTLGKAHLLCEGTDAAILCSGIMVHEALEARRALAAEGLSVRVVNVHTIKPLDQEAVIAAARETGAIVTAENHSILGGLGSAVAETVVEHCPVPMSRIGFRDCFGEVGKMDYLRQRFGMTAGDIARAVRDTVARKAR